MLGMRLTGDDIDLATIGFNTKINENIENIITAFSRALKEECLVNQKNMPKKIA